MSDRHTNHNGRALHGQRTVREEDVTELVTDPDGADHFRDDVKLGGAVADISYEGALRGKEISELVTENRENVERAVHPEKP